MTDRPVLAAGGPIKPADAPWWLDSWQSNGDLIAKVARLGYLDGRVLDATYGFGTFWKVYTPLDLVKNDLYVRDDASIECHYDYRALPPAWRLTFDSVVFDPDYKMNGTPALGEFDVRYGIDRSVTRRHLLVKCMDQVESGRQWWQGDLITNAIAEQGGTKVEEFYYLGGGRAQPADRTKRCPLDTDKDGDCSACRGGVGYPECVDGRVPSVQVHAYARPSKLLIFRRGGTS